MECLQHHIQGQNGADDSTRAINRGEEKTDYGENAGTAPSTSHTPKFHVCVMTVFI